MPEALRTEAFTGADEQAVEHMLDHAERVREANPAEALRLAEEACAAAEQHGIAAQVGRARHAMTLALAVLGRHKQAVEMGCKTLRAYELAGSNGHARAGTEAELHEAIGGAYRALCDFRNALSFYDYARTAAARAGDTERLASILKAIGTVHATLHEYAEALDAYMLALDLMRAAGDTRGEAVIAGNIGNVYAQQSDHRNARKYLLRSLRLKRALKDVRSQAVTLNSLGLVCQRLGKYARAVTRYHESLAIGQLLGDQAVEAAVYGNLCALYQESGDYPGALEYAIKSLEIAQRTGDTYSEAYNYHNVGFLYMKAGDYDAALACLHKALAIWEAIGDQRSAAPTYTNLGAVCYRRGAYGEALEWLGKSLDVARGAGDERDAANALCDIGDVHYAMGDLPSAATCFEQSRALAASLGHRRREGEALLGLSDVRREQGYLDDACAHARAALETAGTIESQEIAYKAHHCLSRALERKGDHRGALAHHQEFHALKERVFNDTSDAHFKKLQAVHEAEAAKRDAELYRVRTVELDALNAQLQRANQRLEEVIREKKDLLHIVAHDLRNPLTALLLTASVLEEDERIAALPDVGGQVGTVLRAASRMELITSRLLSSEMIESDELKLASEPVEFAAIAREAAAQHAAAAAQKNIAVTTAIDELDTRVCGDAGALRQVLDNLLSNAVKYSPQGSTVHMTVTAGSGVVRCSVRDEGPGLTEEDRRKLFRKFARLSAKPTGGETSTGLGLSIVKTFVERMGGRVWCDSAPGAGAVFNVEFARDTGRT
ncbi:sensor histidine kinase [bacterium]|nr:sensor histidine kinase [bacterium]